MTSEVQSLTMRAIIDLLSGDRREFINLSHKAAVINGEMPCACGGSLVSCRCGLRHNMKPGKVCTTCGRVYMTNGEVKGRLVS